MLNRMKEQKTKYGMMGAVILTGILSGVVFKSLREKRREKKILQELEDSVFDNFDI